MRALDLQQQRCEMRRPLEHLTGPSVERSPLIEDDLDPRRCDDTTVGISKHITFGGGAPESAPSQTAMERARTIERSAPLEPLADAPGFRVAANPRAIAINNSNALRAGRIHSDSAALA